MTDFVIPITEPAALDPERVGPKAANLAALTQAGLPTPGGFALTADAYLHQLGHLGMRDAIRAFDPAVIMASRRLAIDVRIALYDQPIAPEILEPVLAHWRRMREQTGCLGVVRSSALIEDRAGANFAGQFESFLGLAGEDEMLTAVRACWAALWTTNVRRYMESNALSPAQTAMSVLIQPLVSAIASGGGLSRTPEDGMLVAATWGLGTSIAQGEIVPDRIVLDRDANVLSIHPGHKDHSDSCQHGGESRPHAVHGHLVTEPCLSRDEARELGRHLLHAEELMGMPVEIEWAMDAAGIKMLQSRPLHVEEPVVPDAIWTDKPGLRGHPAGIGWGLGRAVVIECECQMSRVAPGDILVTKVAGPALSHILPNVAGVVSERGGSTSHLASLARERGIPAVLGVMGATSRIPDGAQVAVDGVAGIVRWM
jgi:pyruvate,water dikinase